MVCPPRLALELDHLSFIGDEIDQNAIAIAHEDHLAHEEQQKLIIRIIKTINALLISSPRSNLETLI